MELIPSSIFPCSSVAINTFLLLLLICNVYILHHWAHDHISYLHYTSLNWGLKMGILHSPPPINCTILSSQHHTNIHIWNLHPTTWYFYKFISHAVIPTNNLSFHSTCKNQASLPTYLHRSPLGCTTSFPMLLHWSYKKSPRCGSRNSSYQMEPCTLIYKNPFNFFQNFQKLVGTPPAWPPHAPT